MPETTFIYMLIDPTTEQIRYIGKSNQPNRRFSNHTTSFHWNYHKINWVKKLQRQGLRPIMQILEEVPFNDWQERERYWISYYREQGCDLLNRADGGEGLSSLSPEHRAKIGESGKGKKRSPESKARIALATKESANRPENKERMSEKFKGKSLSPEHRAKLSTSHKARAATPEGRAEIEKMVDARPRTNSPEVRAKMSASHRERLDSGFTPSEETRAKISASKKGKPRSPEVIAKISAGRKGKGLGPMSEEQKAKQSAIMKAKHLPTKPKCPACGQFLRKDGTCSKCESGPAQFSG